MSAAAGYARYSTPRQDGGFTIEAQEKHIRKLIAEKNWICSSIYKDEAISGSVPPEDRPGLSELIDDAKAGSFQKVISYDASRLARDQHIFWNVIQSFKDAKIVYLTVVMPEVDSTKPEFEILAGTLQGMASYERLIDVRKTKDAMEILKEKGKARGRPMFGFKINEDGYFEPEKLGVQILEMIKTNPKPRAKIVQQELGIEYYKAWSLIKNAKLYQNYHH